MNAHPSYQMLKQIVWTLFLLAIMTIFQLKCPKLFDLPIIFPWFLWGVWVCYWSFDDPYPHFFVPWCVGLWHDIITMGTLGLHALLYFVMIALVETYVGDVAKDQLDGQQMLYACFVSSLVVCLDALIHFEFTVQISMLFLLLNMLIAMSGVVFIYCMIVLKTNYFQSNKRYV